MDERISVAQVLELGVSITWQQAVAVTLEAWHTSVNARVREQPAQLEPESCFLTVKGDVHLPRPAATHRADGALQLLRAMLDGVEAPAELVEVAFGKATDTLSDDLAQFSRPNRRVEIADVASRGFAARAALAIHTPATQATAGSIAPPVTPSVTAERTRAGDAAWPPPVDEFAALRQEAATREPVVPSGFHETKARQPKRLWVAVLAGTIATLAALAAVRGWPGAASAPTMELAPVETPLEVSAPDPAWLAAGHRTADIQLSRRPGASTSVAPAASSGAGARAPAPPEPPTAPAAAATSASATGARPDGEARDNANVEEAAIYSWKSEGVAPPTMVLPRMPTSAFPEPGDDLEDRPYLEVLVNERGSVDAVHLRGNLNSSDAVRHGMMLAPAKAWQFSPATRNGQPVRYIIRVLVVQ